MALIDKGARSFEKPLDKEGNFFQLEIHQDYTTDDFYLLSIKDISIYYYNYNDKRVEREDDTNYLYKLLEEGLREKNKCDLQEYLDMMNRKDAKELYNYIND